MATATIPNPIPIGTPKSDHIVTKTAGGSAGHFDLSNGHQRAHGPGTQPDRRRRPY